LKELGAISSLGAKADIIALRRRDHHHAGHGSGGAWWWPRVCSAAERHQNERGRRPVPFTVSLDGQLKLC
jgi:hypothetical protein